MSQSPFCPNQRCRSCKIHLRPGQTYRESDADTRWKCMDCGNEFDEPEYRESTKPPKTGMARKLWEMDSEQVIG